MPKSIVAFLFFLLVANGASGQDSNCHKLQGLISEKKWGQAKNFVFHSLSQKPFQEDCFFEMAFSLFENAKENALDSIKMIGEVWQTVSRKPCYAKSVQVDFFERNFSSFGQEGFCKVVRDYYLACGTSGLSPRSKQLATLCTNLGCQDLDSILFQEAAFADVGEAQKVTSLLAQRECTESKTYLMLTKTILEKEPTFNAAFHLATTFRNVGKVNEAYHYYTRSEQMARTPEQKSLCYLGIAQTLQLQKNYAKAKDFASLASETDSGNQESFVFLAQLFMQAEKICDFTSIEEKSALYVLISKMYRKANNQLEAENYLKKSGLGGSINESSLAVKIKLGCFINESVELKK